MSPEWFVLALHGVIIGIIVGLLAGGEYQRRQQQTRTAHVPKPEYNISILMGWILLALYCLRWLDVLQ